MSEASMDFTRADDYERFMGRWSRAVAVPFLRWMEPPRGARWLDVGCGSGILAEVVLDSCEPGSVVGVDSSAAQIAQALRGPAGRRAKFERADATRLPFDEDAFDIAASALVLNFVADPLLAVKEMARVVRPGGIIAAYVWDFAPELSPSGPFRRAMKGAGLDVPAIPGTAHSSAAALQSLFSQAGLASLAARAVEVTLAYASFDEFWAAQTTAYSPTTKLIEAMSEAERRRLKRAVREALHEGPGGRIEYSARANAIRARVDV